MSCPSLRWAMALLLASVNVLSSAAAQQAGKGSFLYPQHAGVALETQARALPGRALS